jgi:hypothetical protein
MLSRSEQLIGWAMIESLSQMAIGMLATQTLAESHFAFVGIGRLDYHLMPSFGNPLFDVSKFHKIEDGFSPPVTK